MSENYLPVLAGVAVVRDHVLGLLFSDGMAGDVDFSAEQWTGVLAPLNDPGYFAEVRVDQTTSPDRPDSASSARPSSSS